MNVVTNLPQISSSSVFPDKSPEGVSHAITILSTALTPFRDGPSSRAVSRQHQDGDKLRYVKDFDRFSTLITTGDSANKAANVVNAVTGHIVQQGVQAAIVSRNTKAPHDVALAAKEPFSFVEVTPSDPVAANHLLTTWETPRQSSFAQYVQDVVTIVGFLAQLSRTKGIPSQTLNTAVEFFAGFVHMRAVYKLRARVANGSRCWGEPPVTIIVDEVKRLLGDAQYHPTKSTIELSAAEAKFITAEGIEPSPNSTTFVLDDVRLPSWLSLLEKTYGIIDSETSAASDPKTLPSALSAHVKNIITVMPTFEILVKHLVPAIASDSVARRLRTSYEDKRIEVSAKVDKKISGALATSAHALSCA
ncbi:hypothetical protein EXIGLDRAFT_348160 [Exidia glandulosa HHB12029]|uniref:Uncharacterized protein n=1 Tax=Exidia glandulosa HHB12029 TaxID=1314781 RepID=A0A165LE62_EXIGL|nr:hypothetical protein EXIGLDRAFT_348160 [Exidia glandulosa HHB12029]